MVGKADELQKIVQEAAEKELKVWVAVEREVEGEAEEETVKHAHEVHGGPVKVLAANATHVQVKEEGAA